MVDQNKLLQLLEDYPLPSNRRISYGTAGFRYEHSILDGICVRATCAVVLLLQSNALGIMVTASHNGVKDNGLKLSGPDGGMLSPEQEKIVEECVTKLSPQQLVEKVEANCNSSASQGRVYVGRDTRPHGARLVQRILDTLEAVGNVDILNVGVVTTPMLHHVTRHDVANRSLLPTEAFPNVEGYYKMLQSAYSEILSTAQTTTSTELVVDCACGVGHVGLTALKIPGIVARNPPHDVYLNDKCGSEHVQKSQSPPIWHDHGSSNNNIPYAASLDGDSDRIVFWRQHGPKLDLWDGDQLAALIVLFVQEQLQVLQWKDLTVGVVQTAYANGASTQFLTDRNIPVLLAKTGVKYVHHAACQLDIGIYFESNGHGTIVFGPAFYEKLDEKNSYTSSQQQFAYQRLACLPRLVNQAVGDALSDLLLIHAILQLQNRTLEDRLYVDLPSRQDKIVVPDRALFVTNDTETECLEPAGLQAALKTCMQKCKGRAFCRPSGTENVVRVYAEASTQADADTLCREAIELVLQRSKL